jgi:hypothetical protein
MDMAQCTVWCGMQHDKAEKKDLIEAFKVFGEIEDAAVAPNF